MVDSGDNLSFERLTPREREILRLIAQHRQSKEIARLLRLSPKTVEMHVLSARRRLAGLNRRDAALAFIAWETDPGNDYRKQSAEL
jgi:DNA-binding CsgD family transcriptional regulator